MFAKQPCREWYLGQKTRAVFDEPVKICLGPNCLRPCFVGNRKLLKTFRKGNSVCLEGGNSSHGMLSPVGWGRD